MEKILINTYYVQAAVRERMEGGLIAPHFDFIAGELEREGYSHEGIRRRLRAADVFGQWLVKEGLSLADVTDSVVKLYVAGIPRRPSPQRSKGLLPHIARGVHRVTDLLRKHGAVPPQPHSAPLVVDATEAFLIELDRHMVQATGLAASTRRKHLGLVRAFLKTTFPNAIPDWSLLRPQHVAQFIQERAENLAPTSRMNPIGGIRALLQFLVQRGQIPDGFQGAIPPVREWKHAALPRHLTAEEVERVVALCPSLDPKSRRDRAMILLMVRLGLRPSEVTRLCLPDIDWRSGNLLIRAGKTHRERLMPLPEDAGAALMEYLTMARPRVDRQEVFLSLCPPHAPLHGAGVLTHLATGLLRQAGISMIRYGAYVFRHSAATGMVRRGASFKQVADVLGHQSLRTTAGYAKLDLPALVQVALPWPGDVR
ncbi:MAG: tyrosine-type recombinase/integrase [Bryobacteraceae bacterium]|nr:tyrosine-type recombinase/integrase [Bryobacteraceae bacterium]